MQKIFRPCGPRETRGEKILLQKRRKKSNPIQKKASFLKVTPEIVFETNSSYIFRTEKKTKTKLSDSDEVFDESGDKGLGRLFSLVPSLKSNLDDIGRILQSDACLEISR